MNENTEVEISLEDLFKLIMSKIHIVILWGMGALALAAVYTFLVTTPMYESSSRIVVDQTQQNNENLTNIDIQTNLSLITTFQSIIEEPIILQDVIDQLKSDDTVAELKEKVEVKSMADSLVFSVVVQDENPYEAAELANGIATTFQNKIGEIIKVNSVTILSPAEVSLNPVSPNIPVNLALGLMLGLLIGVSQVILTDMLDKRVKKNTIIAELGWTNLGSISEMSGQEMSEAVLPAKQTQSHTANRTSRRRIEGWDDV